MVSWTGPEQRLHHLQAAARQRGGYGTASRQLAGGTGSGEKNYAEPPSPAHRGGVDLAYLRMHDVRMS